MRAPIVILLLAAGCGGAPPPSVPASPTVATPAPQATPPSDPRTAACEAEPLGAPTFSTPPLPVHGTVVAVALEGLSRLDEATVRAKLKSKPGPLDHAAIADDIHHLWATGDVADVTVIALPAHELRDDLRLVFRVVERPKVGTVFLDGDTGIARDLARRIEGQPLVEPRRIHDFAQEVLDELHRRGHRSAALRVTAHPSDQGLDLCVHAEPGPKTTVARWAITGVQALPKDVLEPIYAHAGVGEPGVVLDDEALELSMLHLQAAYWNHGYLMSIISEPKLTPAGKDQLGVAIEVVEGPVYHYGKVIVEGHARAAYPRIIAPLKKGAVFERDAVMKVVEALREYHAGEKLEVDVHTHLDHQGHTVDLELRMVPPGSVSGTM